MSPLRPPPLFERLVAWTTPGEHREAALGDLEEELHRIAGQRGARAARSWYRRQAVGSALARVRLRGSRPRRLTRRGDAPMLQLLTDLRHSWRGLRRTRVFTAVAVSTIAIGIAANTAIFSALEAVILRPLPFDRPERLVLVHESDRDHPSTRSPLSYPDFADLRERNRSFAEVAAWEPLRPTLTGEGVEPRRLDANSVTHSMFPTLGIEMALGRPLTSSDDVAGAARVVVVSHPFWRTRLEGTPDALGRALRINGAPYTVVGVLPRTVEEAGDSGMLPGASAEIWMPWNAGPSAEVSELRGVHRARVVARLADDVTLEQAADELEAIAESLASEFPEVAADQSLWLEPARTSVARHARSTLLLLFGAVGLVLLLVCANVSSLLLGRAVSRGGEISIRSALGASRLRLLRQLLTESLLLAGIGGVLGALGAWGLLRLVLTSAPPAIPRLQNAGLSAPVLVYSLIVTLLCAAVFGLAPAWQAIRRGMPSARGAATAAGSRVRGALVVGQVALALVLVIGAGLLVRSFWSLLQVDPGFRPQQLLGVALELPLPYVSPEWPRAVEFYQRAVDDVAALPGVVSAAAAYRHPLDAGWGTTFAFSDRPPPEPGDEPEARFRSVTPGYFRTVGVELLAGRPIEPGDVATAPGAVVVNQSFVDRYFGPDDEVLGSRIDYRHWWRAGPDDYAIVGIARDVRYEGLADQERRPAIYFAHAQQPIVEMNLLVRYEGAAEPLVGAIRRAVWRLDPEMPLDRVFEMSHLLDGSISARRFTMTLLVAFAAVALLLASLGVYGVLAFAVHQRRREIAVRMALGASLREVLKMVLRQGAALVGAGTVLGLLVAIWLGRTLESQLHGVRPTDPWTLIAAPTLLGAVALLAGWLPARRAVRVEPASALDDD